MEEEGDALGLRGIKVAMIGYFLNRKQNRQDSKYAAGLLLDLVLELGASERTRTRMENTVCVNTSGKPGGGKHRNMVNEHIVKTTKTAIRGMHSNLKDLNVDKTISSLSIVNQVTEHDMKSMLCESSGSHASNDYIGMERREEISKMNPFSRKRDKLEFYDKCRGSPFSGLNMEKVGRFVDRNKKNFSRKFNANLL